MTESQTHKQVIQYIKIAYPKALYFSDVSAIKMTIGQAVKLNSLRIKGHPDIMIFDCCGKYNGLAIELKREGERIFKRDGSYASEHLEIQGKYLDELEKRGWRACFGIGFDNTKQIIDDYFKETATN